MRALISESRSAHIAQRLVTKKPNYVVTPVWTVTRLKTKGNASVVEGICVGGEILGRNPPLEFH